MSMFWRVAFSGLHIFAYIAIFMLYRDYHFVDPALYEAVKDQKSADAFHVASQLGRFDFASMILGCVSIFIALAAIFAFLEIKNRAEESARKAAQQMVNEKLAELFEAELKKRPPISPSMVNLTPDQESQVIDDAPELKP